MPHRLLAQHALPCPPLAGLPTAAPPRAPPALPQAKGSDLRTHFKNSREAAHALRGKDLQKAKEYMQAVIDRKRCVPFLRFNGEKGARQGPAVKRGLLRVQPMGCLAACVPKTPCRAAARRRRAMWSAGRPGDGMAARRPACGSPEGKEEPAWMPGAICGTSAVEQAAGGKPSGECRRYVASSRRRWSCGLETIAGMQRHGSSSGA